MDVKNISIESIKEKKVFSMKFHKYVVYLDYYSIKTSDICRSYKWKVFCHFLDFNDGKCEIDEKERYLSKANHTYRFDYDSRYLKCPILSIKFIFYNDEIDFDKIGLHGTALPYK